jgi:hypothetical protein
MLCLFRVVSGIVSLPSFSATGQRTTPKLSISRIEDQKAKGQKPKAEEADAPR